MPISYLTSQATFSPNPLASTGPKLIQLNASGSCFVGQVPIPAGGASSLTVGHIKVAQIRQAGTTNWVDFATLPVYATGATSHKPTSQNIIQVEMCTPGIDINFKKIPLTRSGFSSETRKASRSLSWALTRPFVGSDNYPRQRRHSAQTPSIARDFV